MSRNESEAARLLMGIQGIGPVSLRRAFAETGSLARLLELEAGTLRQWFPAKTVDRIRTWRQWADPEMETAKLNRMGARYVLESDGDFPVNLRHLPDRPFGLYRYGMAIEEPAIAIVGTRGPSPYGREICRRLVRDLAGAGFTILSGLARGIDTEAHQAALAAGGKTAAVIGSGLDRLYPAENRGLMEQVAESAGVWTEFPFGRKADRQTFPQRNRLVSGICEAVVVVESGRQGGSMITARFAGEQGRLVFAVPGRLNDDRASGCHLLIREGAQLLTGAEDILAELGMEREWSRDQEKAQAELFNEAEAEACSPAEEKLLEQFDKQLVWHPDLLSETAGIAASETGTLLMMLELKGRVRKRPDGCYEAL